jgi:nitrate/TMAO reductase-like tetraheme cytochrome c subunit
MRFNFKMPDLSRPRVRMQMSLYAGAVAIGGLFFVAAFFPLASNPTFCGVACHSQAPQWESWKNSAHSEVTCYACHVDKSYISLLEEKLIAGPKGMYEEAFKKYEKPINFDSHYSKKLPAERCKRCHANQNRKFTFSRGIYMDHDAHDEAGIGCAVCHNRVAHKGAEEIEPMKSWPETQEAAERLGKETFKYKNYMTMTDGCFRCHSGSPESRDPNVLALIKNGKKAPATCTACHTSDFKLPEGHGPNVWRSEHGAVAKRDFQACLDCHAAGAQFDDNGKTWCGLCHDDEKVDVFKKQAGISTPEPEPEPVAPEEGGEH